MNIGGPGGISMSSGPSGNHTSLGGPNGINISHGPNGSYTSLGGPSGINSQGGLFGDSDDDDDDDDDFWQTGLNNDNTFFGTGNNINGLPFPGISINSNNNMNNVYGGNNVPGGNNVYGANYGNNNGNNWGTVPPSSWPDHVRKNYEEGMAAGQRAMDEAFGTMSGMGIGPWEMGGWPRPTKQKKRGSKARK